jgi:hypothetical protein
MNSEITAEIIVPIAEKRFAQERNDQLIKEAEWDKKVAEYKANEA